ncbi:MAG: hypothetical protein AAGI22_10145 [Planctomycetota bacterium]
MSKRPSEVGTLIEWFETHDVDEMRRLVDAGVDVKTPHRGMSISTWYLESYMRSTRFSEGLVLLLDAGATLDDPALAPVLLDDPDAIRAAAAADPRWMDHVVSMRSTFTSLRGATLLHLAAEYGLEGAAEALLALGADPNACAAFDEHGRGGHTPLFHTVHAHRDFGAPVRRRLLEAGARVDVLVAALPWGEGFEWETTFLDVTPLSYCHQGLLRQVHRDEETIYGVLRELLEAAGRPGPPLPNVPNAYLKRR